jgi:hypothetical protein
MSRGRQSRTKPKEPIDAFQPATKMRKNDEFKKYGQGDKAQTTKRAREYLQSVQLTKQISIQTEV